MANAGMSIKLDPVKTRSFLTHLNAVALQVQSRSQQVLVHVANEIMTESLLQVPKDTLALMQSAYVDVSSYRRSIIQITIGYGGKSDTMNPKTHQLASSYAIQVHENLAKYHPVGKAKFLEDPINEYASRFTPRIAALFKGMFGGVVRG